MMFIENPATLRVKLPNNENFNVGEYFKQQEAQTEWLSVDRHRMTQIVKRFAFIRNLDR